jgi:ribose transport system substrate-binding protein
VGVVERAAGRGIPVSIFDSGINTDKIVSFVATDNYGDGALGARRLGVFRYGMGHVGVIGFMPGCASTR